jgi:hypothetical protein
MRDFAHIWQAAETIVYIAGLRARVRVHAPGLKAPEGESIFCQCARRLDGNNSGSGSSLASSAQSCVNPSLKTLQLHRREPDAKANDSESLARTGRNKR